MPINGSANNKKNTSVSYLRRTCTNFFLFLYSINIICRLFYNIKSTIESVSERYAERHILNVSSSLKARKRVLHANFWNLIFHAYLTRKLMNEWINCSSMSGNFFLIEWNFFKQARNAFFYDQRGFLKNYQINSDFQ